MALAAAINGLRSLIGFLAVPEHIYTIADRTGSSLLSSLAASALGLGLLCANPRHGPMGLVVGSGPGGRIYRLLIAPAVLVPLLVGALTIRGQALGLFGVGLGVAVQAFANLLIFWWLARALNRSGAAAEREADRAVKALEMAELRMRRLRGLGDIDRAINSQPEHVGAIFDVLLEAVRGQLGVDLAAVLLHERPGELRYARASGLRAPPRAPLRDDHSYLGQAVLSSSVVGNDTAPFPPHAATEELQFGYAVPLLAREGVIGVLEVGHREPLTVDAEWMQFLETLANQAALALAQFRLFDDLQRSNSALVQAYDATLAGWSYALELRDGETRGHTERVTALTLKLATACGIGGEELIHIRRGALLHDIGKLGVPDAILLKPGKLTDEEWAVMRRHPLYAYQWLEPIAFLRPALAIPYCHHERWDGSGYPRGLRGAQIPLAARIFAVVDVWDALRSERPYHAPWPAAEVKAHIAALAGSQFDPQVVELFLALVDDEEQLRERSVGE
jgi:HD-GYP domain-containing protein (c-di-GMP phosphodiesterase class II)